MFCGLRDLSKKTKHTSTILDILNDLLRREHDKVVAAFKAKGETLCPDFKGWSEVYSEREQISRLLSAVLFRSSDIDDYDISDILPSKLADAYQEILNSFLPQHPFLRISRDDEFKFAGPAFRDFLLAKALFIKGAVDIADMYFDDSDGLDYTPSPIFFDCYWGLCEDRDIQLKHIDLLYRSFISKAFANESASLKLYEFDNVYMSEFVVANRVYNKEVDIGGGVLAVNNLINAEINTPFLTVEIGNSVSEARLSDSTILCNRIVWKTKFVTIETERAMQMLVSKNELIGNPNFDILNQASLKISAPNVKKYFRLTEFAFDYDNCSDEEDVTVFIHRLRHILIEFRTHGKNALGKTADMINNVLVGNSYAKQMVLDYLLDRKIIYQSKHLYLVDEDKSKSLGINFSGLLSVDIDQFEDLFRDFKAYKSQRITISAE